VIGEEVCIGISSCDEEATLLLSPRSFLVLSGVSSVDLVELSLLLFASSAPVRLDGDEGATGTVTRVIRRVSVDG